MITAIEFKPGNIPAFTIDNKFMHKPWPGIDKLVIRLRNDEAAQAESDLRNFMQATGLDVTEIEVVMPGGGRPITFRKIRPTAAELLSMDGGSI